MSEFLNKKKARVGVLPVLTPMLVMSALAVATASSVVATERAPAPEHILRAHNFSAGTAIRLRPELDRPRLKTANFEVSYSTNFPLAAEIAFQRAVDIWSAIITSPVTIRIDARWQPLASGVLGGASAVSIWREFPNAPLPNTWYVDALADALAGSDRNPDGFDINAVFNSTFSNWYFGTDGNPGAAEFDLVTVVLHEIGHGLGMTGSMQVDNAGFGSWGLGTGFPIIYDVFTETTGGAPLLATSSFPNPSITLGDALQDRVFFDGPNADSVLGMRPELYAPSTFLGGSSYSHFDENLFPFGTENGLMTPFLAMDEVIHDPGDQLLCLFEDLGWETTATCDEPPPVGCVPSDEVLCLQGGRFRVEVDWSIPNGNVGVGRRVTTSEDSGLLYFFNPNNWEMLVKVLNQCNGSTNRFWVFAGATTNVEYTLTVTDTQTNQVRTYFNPQGMSAPAITDTNAFATCP